MPALTDAFEYSGTEVCHGYRVSGFVIVLWPAIGSENGDAFFISVQSRCRSGK